MIILTKRNDKINEIIKEMFLEISKDYKKISDSKEFELEFDTDNLIDVYKVSGYKNKLPMVRVSDLKFSPPKLLYNLDENKIEKVIPSKYITIFLKDNKSDNEVSFYLTSTETSTEFPEGVYKNIEVKKGQITAKHSCIFK